VGNVTERERRNGMNLEERMLLWLLQNEEPSEARDLLNDALEEIERLRGLER
jgi:hypothetical protein